MEGIKGLLYSSLWFAFWIIIGWETLITEWENDVRTIYLIIVVITPFGLFMKQDIDARYKKIADDYKARTGSYPWE